jgi:hypothetical protein
MTVKDIQKRNDKLLGRTIDMSMKDFFIGGGKVRYYYNGNFYTTETNIANNIPLLDATSIVYGLTV